MSTKVRIRTIVSLVCAAILFSAVFLLPQKTKAASEHEVIFYEIMWPGSRVSSADEWIVLKNITSGPINLNGWKIQGFGNNFDKEVILKGSIGSGGYFLLSNNTEDYKYTNGESTLAIKPDQFDTTVDLNDTKLNLELVDSGGAVTDLAGDGGIPFAGTKRTPGPAASMLRSGPFDAEHIKSGDQRDAWFTNQNQKNLDDGAIEWATPQNSGKPSITSQWPDMLATEVSAPVNLELSIENGNGGLSVVVNNDIKTLRSVKQGKNNIPLKCPKIGQQEVSLRVIDETGLYDEISGELFCYQFADLVINEVYPAPQKGEEEWVEIFNPTDKSVNLEKWILNDRSGDNYTFSAQQVVSAGGYLKIYPSDISLNNDGDELELLSPAEELVDSVEWNKAKKGTSWARFEGDYKWTLQPTPGTPNVFLEEESDEEVSEETSNNGSTTDSEDTSPNGGGAKSKKTITTKKVVGGEKMLALALNSERLPKLGESANSAGNFPLSSPLPLENAEVVEITFGSIGILALARVVLAMVSLWL